MADVAVRAERVPLVVKHGEVGPQQRPAWLITTHSACAGIASGADRRQDAYNLGVSDFDIFLADCPARTTLGLIGNSWSVVVIAALGEQPRRFGQLQERIGGISNKVLAETLARLGANGLVQRRELPTAPRGVEYALSPLGQTLLEPVQALCRWAETHTDAVLDMQVTER